MIWKKIHWRVNPFILLVPISSNRKCTVVSAFKSSVTLSGLSTRSRTPSAPPRLGSCTSDYSWNCMLYIRTLTTCSPEPRQVATYRLWRDAYRLVSCSSFEMTLLALKLVLLVTDKPYIITCWLGLEVHTTGYFSHQLSWSWPPPLNLGLRLSTPLKWQSTLKKSRWTMCASTSYSFHPDLFLVMPGTIIPFLLPSPRCEREIPSS